MKRFLTISLKIIHTIYAAVFVREVREASCSLNYLAERGRIVPEFGDSNICELFVGRYRLIYQITKQTIYILGFIHGARDLLALWKRESRSDSDGFD